MHNVAMPVTISAAKHRPLEAGSSDSNNTNSKSTEIAMSSVYTRNRKSGVGVPEMTATVLVITLMATIA